MIKILFIIWSLERGGAERFLAGLLKNIDLKKFQPVLCCLNWKGNWAKDIESRGIEVIALNKKGGIDITAYRKLVELIERGKFDIVNTHLWGADVMGRLAAITSGVPIIISTAQNVDVWKRWWHRAIDRFLVKRTKRIIAVSNAVKEYYSKVVGIPEYKIEVIPNAIDIGAYENVGDTAYLYKEFDLKNDDVILACVGRLNVQKGHVFLFKALELLKSDFPKLKVLIVGDGEERDKLMQAAKEKGIYDMVRFTRQRQDIAEILKFSKGLVLPSIFEGMPLCVLEAMASARPVIATDVGGVRELAVDQKTAFIVPKKNAESLAAAIKKLIQMPDHGRQMGEMGKKIVKRDFSIQLITQKTSDLFEMLIRIKS